MSFLEIFEPGLQHLREEKDRQKMLIVRPSHGGGAPLGIDLDAGTATIGAALPQDAPNRDNAAANGAMLRTRRPDSQARVSVLLPRTPRNIYPSESCHPTTTSQGTVGEPPGASAHNNQAHTSRNPRPRKSRST